MWLVVHGVFGIEVVPSSGCVVKGGSGANGDEWLLLKGW